MPELRRELGLSRATTYGVGQILGAGIYTILGEAAGQTGESLGISFFLAALVASFTGLSYAELSSRYPVEEGDFIYVRRAFENQHLSVFTAVIRLLVGVIAAATVALAFAGYLSAFVSSPAIPVAIILLVLMSIVNFVGIDISTKLNVAFVAVEVVGLLLVIWAGFGSWETVNTFEMRNGVIGLFHAAFLILFAYIGFEDLVNVTEETRDAAKTIPRAILLSIGTTTILYIFVSVSSVGAVSAQDLGQSDSPLTLVAEAGLGPGAAIAVTTVALFATTNTALINLISTSRLVYGVSKEEYATFPTIFSRIHPSRQTPHIAIALVGVIAILFTFFGDVGTVAALANLSILTLFTLVNASLLKIRFRAEGEEPEFRAPLNVGRLSLTAIAGFVFSLALIVFYSSILL